MLRKGEIEISKLPIAFQEVARGRGNICLMLECVDSGVERLCSVVMLTLSVLVVRGSTGWFFCRSESCECVAGGQRPLC